MFDPNQALIALLTIETLLLAVFTLTLSLGDSSLLRTVSGKFARGMAATAAVSVTVLSIGATTAWADVFLSNESLRGFSQWCPAVAIGFGVVAQPIFAWVLVARIW